MSGLKKVFVIFMVAIVFATVINVFLGGVNATVDEFNTSNLKSDYLKSNNGIKITFYIPDGFIETDFAAKSDSYKGYHKGALSVGLQIVSKDRADEIKKNLLSEGYYKEGNYTVNNKTYTQMILVQNGQEKPQGIYLYKINDDIYYFVYAAFVAYFSNEEINSFLTINIENIGINNTTVENTIQKNTVANTNAESINVVNTNAENAIVNSNVENTNVTTNVSTKNEVDWSKLRNTLPKTGSDYPLKHTLISVIFIATALLVLVCMYNKKVGMTDETKR